MALLFIKQKLFPSRGAQPKQSPLDERILEVPSSKKLRRPLLGHTQDPVDIHPDGDLEAQHLSYDTFCPELSEDTGSTGSTRSRVNPRIISDAILGLSDGLTVPFALTAGLSALGDTKLVVLGGLAELAAGAISMGLGGYVGAKSEAESYETTIRETKALIESCPLETDSIVRETFVAYGISDTAIAELTQSLHESQERLLQFLIAFHHKECEPDCNQAYISAITLALGYFIGGFIPLIPYFFISQVLPALYCSIGVMGVTLMVFGYIKTCIVRGWSGSHNIIAGLKGGFQMVVVGGVAAGAAIGLVGLIDQGGSN